LLHSNAGVAAPAPLTRGRRRRFSTQDSPSRTSVLLRLNAGAAALAPRAANASTSSRRCARPPQNFGKAHWRLAQEEAAGDGGVMAGGGAGHVRWRWVGRSVGEEWWIIFRYLGFLIFLACGAHATSTNGLLLCHRSAGRWGPLLILLIHSQFTIRVICKFSAAER
jgi:hypothetical protein